MNEMRLYTSFMNGVTSLFVPDIYFEQDNKVSRALAPHTKKGQHSFITQLKKNCDQYL